MIGTLTRNRVVRVARDSAGALRQRLSSLGSGADKRALGLKAFTGALLLGLGSLFYGTVVDYQGTTERLRAEGGEAALAQLPSVAPLVWQGIGVFLALVAFLVSLWVREDTSDQGRRGNLIIIALWIAAFASLAAWVPTDVIETKRAISGKALAGATPSIPAYLGKLFLITVLILSIPSAAVIYFRLSLMDRYVVHSFLSPFSFCLFSFIGIWLIADFTDNGAAFAGLPLSRVTTFYVVQVPFVILFVMPIVVLLSALFALNKLSRSNELISMIGAGRSVLRILTPLIVVGAYSAFVCLVFKYEWAPSSVGYKEAILDTAIRESWAKRQGKTLQRDVWAKRGWMHVNDVERRTWFVGKVPYELSDDMADVVIWQLDGNDQPDTIWKASRAGWKWNTSPPSWVLSDVRIYEYDEKQIPRITSREQLVIEDWSETPWKVLSSSQNPEYLGIPGLTMYLKAHQNLDDERLAPFRTNWWYVFAEPMTCFVMILVAAPLGIVQSRRGVMTGVTAAIGVFAFMYVMRGTTVALGHRGSIPPFVAAWSTHFVVGTLGVVLLWFRARNRETPTLRGLVKDLFRRRKPTPTPA